MTVCNMAIEAGARAGLVGVDETTIAYVKGRPYHARRARMGAGGALLAHAALRPRRALRPVVELDAAQIRPQVTWGTSPEMVLSIDDRVPDPDREKDASKRDAIERALQYMALEPNKPITDIRIDKVFIGSCTNSRIEDLREAAAVVRRLGAQGRRQRQAGDGRAGLGPGEGAGRARRARRGLQGAPASNGASPAARCAWR